MSIRNELLEEILAAATGGGNISPEVFEFKVGGNPIIAVSDLTVYTEIMPIEFNSADFGIRFYSDSSALVPVGPTAGTIEFTGSTDILDAAGNGNDTDFRYRKIIEGIILGSEVDDEAAPIINAQGVLTKVRITLSGIAGASYFRTWVRRG